jgi:hypothetical protein
MSKRTPLSILLVLLAAAAIVVSALPLSHGASAASGSRVLLGAYRWNASAVDGYSAWLGRDVDLGMDFMPSGDGQCSTNWNVIDGNSTILDSWSRWVKAKAGRNVVFGVPMLSPLQPGNPSIGCWNVDANAIASELRAGASGAYNSHFRALAQNMVSRGLGNAKLRIGWEAGGNWYRYQFGPDVTAWKGLFRQIVTTMRGVPGANFEFVFNAGTASWTRDLSGRVVPVTEAWPGDDVVDTIGFDGYCNNNTWSDFLNGTGSQAGDSKLDQGLTFWSQFAAAHGKPMAFPEWGIKSPRDCGDNNGAVSYVQNMHDWMATHNVAWHVYFDVNPSCSYIVSATNQCAFVSDGDHQLMPASDGRIATHYPAASALYKQLFSKPLVRTSALERTSTP